MRYVLAGDGDGVGVSSSAPRRHPSSVYLAGDSAGGNLLFGVLSHLAHAHPEIEALDLPGGRLGGAIPVSPWVSLETDFTGSDEIYAGGDIVTTAVAPLWAPPYLGARPRDHYTDVSRAPGDWLAAFPVDGMLMLAGGKEILRPMIEEFMQRLSVRLASVSDSVF